MNTIKKPSSLTSARDESKSSRGTTLLRRFHKNRRPLVCNGTNRSRLLSSPEELRGELGGSFLPPHTPRRLSEKTSALTIPHRSFFSTSLNTSSLYPHPFFLSRFPHSFRACFVEFDKKGLFKIPLGCIIITSHFSKKNI